MINDRKQLGRRIVKDESLFSNMGFGELPSPLSGLPRMEVKASSGLSRIFKFGIIAWLINIVIGLAFFGVIGYVAYHFISKFW